MTQETSNYKRTYAIIELDTNSGRLAYFEDDHPDIWYDSDIYWFKAKAEMTDEEYQEYIFTIDDLTKHYKAVFVCTQRSIIRFIDDVYHAEMVDSLAIRGTPARYGTKDTVIIINPMTKPYVSPFEDYDEEEYGEENSDC